MKLATLTFFCLTGWLCIHQFSWAGTELDPLNAAELTRISALIAPAAQPTNTVRTFATTPSTETLLVERHINAKGATTRLADVYTYDYTTNETIISVVNVTSNKIISTQRKRNLQLPLTTTEIERATQLIFNDDEQRTLLNKEFKRITGNELTTPQQLNVKAFVFLASSLPERLNPASKQCGLERCAQVLLYTQDSIVFEVSPIVNLSAGIVTQTIGF